MGFAVLGCAIVNLWTAAKGVRFSPAMNTDFLAFWSFPRFAAANPVAGLYDATALNQFQQALYPGFHSFYPFLYPPTLLLVTWWLRCFSYGVAELIWTVAGLAMLVAAAWVFFKPGERWLVIAAMLACPASLLNWVTGETAYFTTALLLLGFAALPERKILAGIAFGLLTLKPQLGVLIPFALLARGEWRTIFTAGIVALGLVALSCAVFPAGLWAAWAKTLPVYQAQYFANGSRLNLNIIVTPAANLVALGMAPKAAWLVQVAAAVLVAGAVWRLFRRGPYDLAVAALLVGSFLAVPHAYAYDSISLTAAMGLTLRYLTPPDAGMVVLGLAIYLGPLLLLTPAYHWFVNAAPETLLFIAIIMQKVY